MYKKYISSNLVYYVYMVKKKILIALLVLASFLGILVFLRIIQLPWFQTSKIVVPMNKDEFLEGVANTRMPGDADTKKKQFTDSVAESALTTPEERSDAQKQKQDFINSFNSSTN